MLALTLALSLSLASVDDAFHVTPAVETAPVPSRGDAADDSAMWVHPTDPTLSVIIGTDKGGGIGVYALDGSEIEYRADGPMNNVDVRQGVDLGEGPVDLVSATCTGDDSFVVYELDAKTRTLTPRGRFETGTKKVYGLCMYHSAYDGSAYVIVNTQKGVVTQWKLSMTDGEIISERVRKFDVGGKTEGMVADDENGLLYVGEEEAAIWRYDAEPDTNDKREIVDAVSPVGSLHMDIEGLTLYASADGGGYLIASSQGSDTFHAYDREPPNALAFTFRVGEGEGVDEVTHTDGIDACATPLGRAYPRGVFVVQDDANPGANQNFKLISWEQIERRGR